MFGLGMASMKRLSDQPLRLKTFSVYHLPAILFGCVIVTLSSIPNLSTPEIGFTISDKLAHFLEYAVFSTLVLRSMTDNRHRYNSKRGLLGSAIFVTFFAVADELFLQRFIPGRSSDLYDLLADLSGAFLVLLVALIFFRSGSETS